MKYDTNTSSWHTMSSMILILGVQCVKYDTNTWYDTNNWCALWGMILILCVQCEVWYLVCYVKYDTNTWCAMLSDYISVECSLLMIFEWNAILLLCNCNCCQQSVAWDTLSPSSFWVVMVRSATGRTRRDRGIYRTLTHEAQFVHLLLLISATLLVLFYHF